MQFAISLEITLELHDYTSELLASIADYGQANLALPFVYDVLELNLKNYALAWRPISAADFDTISLSSSSKYEGPQD